MLGFRTAAFLGAGIAMASVASARPRRRGARMVKASGGAVGWSEDGGVPELGEFTVWPPPPTAGHRGRGRRGG